MPNFSGIWTVTQQMQAKGQSIWPDPPPTTIGQAFGGGYYAGQIGVSSVATHYLVVAPLSSGQSQLKWKNARTATPGASSDINGPQNTADMVADGNSTVYPAAHFCNDLVTGGYSDWYMPAQNELEVCYFNLKPTVVINNTSSGINPNSIPAQASNYTTLAPPRTSVVAFQFGGAEAFTNQTYWGSTQYTPDTTKARYQNFNTGSQIYGVKDSTSYVRAVRRVAV